MKTNKYRRGFAALLATAALGAVATADEINVIFYGNSFTLGFGSTRSVNAVFTDIAVAAGEDQPFVQSAAASGQAIGWHVDNNTSPIFTNIPPDRDWTHIVMQEHSTKLTRAWPAGREAGIAESKMDTVDLYNVAATRSPNVQPVLYETWARGPGHSFYTGNPPLYTDAFEMQAEVRDGYEQLQMNLDNEIGSPFTKLARVGDAWEAANYQDLHSADLWHAQNRGTLLAALVIYGTIYDDMTTSDIDLTNVLGSLGLDSADGAFLTAAADQILIPEPSSLALLAIAGIALVRNRGRVL